MSMLMKAVGFSYLQRMMHARAQRLKDRERVNQQATVVVDRWIQKNFDEQGKPAMGGAGWRPLSAQTLARRRTGLGGGSPKILIDKGDLKKKWKHLWTANLAKVQSGVDYAAQHHKGLYGLPVRRILPTDKQVAPLLARLYKHFVKASIR